MVWHWSYICSFHRHGYALLNHFQLPWKLTSTRNSIYGAPTCKLPRRSVQVLTRHVDQKENSAFNVFSNELFRRARRRYGGVLETIPNWALPCWVNMLKLGAGKLRMSAWRYLLVSWWRGFDWRAGDWPAWSEWAQWRCSALSVSGNNDYRALRTNGLHWFRASFALFFSVNNRLCG